MTDEQNDRAPKTPVFTWLSLALGGGSVLCGALSLIFMAPMIIVAAFALLFLGAVLGVLAIPFSALAWARKEKGCKLALFAPVPGVMTGGVLALVFLWAKQAGAL